MQTEIPKDIKSPEFIDLLAEKIAAKILESKKKQKQIQIEKDENFWIESDKYLICNPCLNNSKRLDVPRPLLAGKKGNFGYIIKATQPQIITSSKKRHCDSPLHLWCYQEFKKKSEQSIEDKKKNEIAAKKVIRNALFCLKRSLGAQDFLELNAKDFLAENDSESYNIASRNDSKVEFLDSETSFLIF